LSCFRTFFSALVLDGAVYNSHYANCKINGRNGMNGMNGMNEMNGMNAMNEMNEMKEWNEQNERKVFTAYCDHQ
jgi:hypothetical protein